MNTAFLGNIFQYLDVLNGVHLVCQPHQEHPRQGQSPSRRTQQYNGMQQEVLKASHPGSGGSISITDLFHHSHTPHFDSFTRFCHISAN